MSLNITCSYDIFLTNHFGGSKQPAAATIRKKKKKKGRAIAFVLFNSFQVVGALVSQKYY